MSEHEKVEQETHVERTREMVDTEAEPQADADDGDTGEDGEDGA